MSSYHGFCNRSSCWYIIVIIVIFVLIWSNFLLFLNLVPIFNLLHNLGSIQSLSGFYSVISSCIFTERHLYIQYLLHVVPNISFVLWYCWDTIDETGMMEALLNQLWSNTLPRSNYILTGCQKSTPSLPSAYLFWCPLFCTIWCWRGCGTASYRLGWYPGQEAAALKMYLWQELDSDVRILFGVRGWYAIYQEKDMLSLPGKPLIQLVQSMLKNNWSHPSIAVVVVIDLKLARLIPFLFRVAGLAALPIRCGGNLSLPVMFVHYMRFNLSLELRISGTMYNFITKSISSIGKSLAKKAGSSAL